MKWDGSPIVETEEGVLSTAAWGRSRPGLTSHGMISDNGRLANPDGQSSIGETTRSSPPPGTAGTCWLCLGKGQHGADRPMSRPFKSHPRSRLRSMDCQSAGDLQRDAGREGSDPGQSQSKWVSSQRGEASSTGWTALERHLVERRPQ